MMMLDRHIGARVDRPWADPSGLCRASLCVSPLVDNRNSSKLVHMPHVKMKNGMTK